ncbi:hypothetical protein [Prosthecobacter sp.]|uniref:hypothetical protein n=1 Tax=Prosthecobacter sp. TaxID=1965333 RepID=UPI0025DF21D0|nr:hypothetical protein [Prosthecobacter sp.]
MKSNMEELFQTLQKRRRPEDVAEMIAEKFGDELNKTEREMLDKAAAGSLKRMFHSFTLRWKTFAYPFLLKGRSEKDWSCSGRQVPGRPQNVHARKK